ncbi:AMP-binding protein [Pseudomaricurvus alkylphenolicus]|uniref:AMP-binding protein n=1 Tax=Pseudomaricurvus alkylphenolicus TaxID=1306991 RepID=UPI001423FC83|nr:AMP-binding protein [Pseudomaricurvus alkylphenolicus]NIB40661.1 AMP-binding protein [Pseudomaricurvus alkylphenolicus]
MNKITNTVDSFLQFEAQSPEAPYLHKPDLTGNWEMLTRADVGKKARQLARFLQQQGIERGARIGILSDNSPSWCIADLANMMAGYVTVSIFTTMNLDTVQYVIDHSDMQALIIGPASNWESIKASLPESLLLLATEDGPVNDCRHCLNDIWDSIEPLATIKPRSSEELTSIVYTSGTTGLPKGVMISLNFLYQASKGYSDHYATNERGRLFSYLPLSHIAERVIVWGSSLYSGCQVFFNRSLETFQSDVAYARPTQFFGAPRIYANFQTWAMTEFGRDTLEQAFADRSTAVEAGRKVKDFLGLSSVKVALVGSAPTPVSLHQWYEQAGLPLCEVWGQTEVLPATASDPDFRKPGTVGRPIAGCQIKISTEGEVLARTPYLFSGYWKNAEQTSKTIVDGWIHTGDRGRIDEDGFLTLTGRVSELFKTAKGKYVAPVPIEEKFAKHPYVDQLCLQGLGLAQPVMLVVLSTEAQTMDPESVQQALATWAVELNSQLENHEKMGRVIVCDEPWSVENGLLTHTLKIKRASLWDKYHHLLSLEQSGPVSALME